MFCRSYLPAEQAAALPQSLAIRSEGASDCQGTMTDSCVRLQGMPVVQLEGIPTSLRRHGDEIELLPGGYWVAHGRTDDTMNLGGIKVCMSPTFFHLPCCCTCSCVGVMLCWLPPVTQWQSAAASLVLVGLYRLGCLSEIVIS